jgi:hypothetical protein
MPQTAPSPEFLNERLQQIRSGLEEGIRREVARLRREGLPVYVAGPDGSVIDANAARDISDRAE